MQRPHLIAKKKLINNLEMSNKSLGGLPPADHEDQYSLTKNIGTFGECLLLKNLASLEKL